jgi:hypothetical protein
VFPDITQSTDFGVLGIQLNSPSDPASLVTSGFAVSFDAASGAYVIQLPSVSPGKFFAETDNGSTWGGSIVPPYCCVLMHKPAAITPGLTYTSFAEYSPYGFEDTYPAGVFAFGQATPAAAMPITGTATMDATVRGLAVDQSGVIGGTATLQFDFGAGTLAGHFDPIWMNYVGGTQYALGQYAFINTVYGVGSTTFSGGLSHSNPLLTGAFNGLFTGPNAEELMARWTGRYFIAGITPEPKDMFGVWVGKKR